MSEKTFNSHFGLIGDNLDLKSNIQMSISKNGKIKSLNYDDTADPVDFQTDKDCFLLIPGLINSHIHIGDSFAKEAGYNLPLKKVVAPPYGIKHKLLKTISEQIKIRGIHYACREMLSTGTICFADFREEGLEGVKMLKQALQKLNSPPKVVILGRFKDLEELELVYSEGNGLGLVTYGLVSSDVNETIEKLKASKQKIVACHCAENLRKEDRIARIFHDNIINLIVHGTKFQKKDLISLKERNISLVLCPRSNAYFGAGFPPLKEIIELQIPVSLGTDNVMANSLDLFEEMRYFFNIYNASKRDDWKVLSARNLLKMVTINAAKALQMERERGSIKVGKYADFCMIRLTDHNYFVNQLHKDNILPLVVQRTKPENIKKVYIKGGKVFERN